VQDPDEVKGSWRSIAMIGLLAGAVVSALYGLTAHLHLDLFDEGFLWYGVLRTAAGEVPGLDFQAYDPARYYWGAAWSFLLGDGILALRLSTAIFQALGLFAGLLAARRIVTRPYLLVPVALVLGAWMFPRHKLFEPSLALMAILLATRMLERPSRRRCLVAGAFVGIAAVFGRNHGVYCGAGFLLAILIQHRKQPDGRLTEKLRMLAGGVLLGYSPMFLMLAFVPGFATHVAESLLRLTERGTNLPLPIPWPWTLPYASLQGSHLAAELTVAITYLVLALAYPLGLIWAFITRSIAARGRAVLVACVCLGIPYAHHACVRAAPGHLAGGIQPLLLGLFALPCALGLQRRRLATWLIWSTLCLGAAIVAWGVHPELSAFGRHSNVPLADVNVAGDRLAVPAYQAPVLTGIKRAVKRHVPPDAAIFMAPFRVSYYPHLRRVAPLWDIYMLWSATDEYQDQMIRDLETKHVDWALIIAEALAEDPNTAFARTHPKVNAYLAREFDKIQDPQIPIGHYLMHRRSK
jgi:hypothetical protein